jgi:hypothetical protein
MTTEAATTAVSQPAAARPTTSNLIEEDVITISLGISNPTDPDLVDLVVPIEQQYISIPQGFNGTITWNLDGEGTENAHFENPPITVNGIAGTPTLSVQEPKTITVPWSNITTELQGISFFYTIQLLVEIGNLRIPIAHDPTVHNDPPTP